MHCPAFCCNNIGQLRLCYMTSFTLLRWCSMACLRRQLLWRTSDVDSGGNDVTPLRGVKRWTSLWSCCELFTSNHTTAFLFTVNYFFTTLKCNKVHNKWFRVVPITAFHSNCISFQLLNSIVNMWNFLSVSLQNLWCCALLWLVGSLVPPYSQQVMTSYFCYHLLFHTSLV